MKNGTQKFFHNTTLDVKNTLKSIDLSQLANDITYNIYTLLDRKKEYIKGDVYKIVEQEIQRLLGRA